MAILLSFPQGSNHSSDIQFTYRDVISPFDQLVRCLLLKGQSFWYTESRLSFYLATGSLLQTKCLERWDEGRCNMEMFSRYVETESCELGGLKNISKRDLSS